MGLFGNILDAAIDTVILPLDIVVDTVMVIPDVVDDKPIFDRTASRLEDIADDLDE